MSENQALAERIQVIATEMDAVAQETAAMSAGAAHDIAQSAAHDGSFFMMGLTVFMLACFVGYYVVWRVTPALHSPLMGVTNAISSVIIVGAIIATGSAESGIAKFVGFLAIVLASINIFGGFIVTQRMLSMFKKK
jgi:NAD(P) transhydrogenase subunit alpha